MLDLFNQPVYGDIQQFTRPCTVTNTQWETWRKPRGVSMAHILCISGGAGGGGGFTDTGTDGGGGGSGGSSGVTRITVPIFLLPPVLYIQVGAGGTGAAAGGTGGSGVLSYVAIAPNTTASNIIAISGAAAPVGGSPGTVSAGGAGGAAGSIAVIGSMPLAGLGLFNMIAGQDGVIGGDDLGANGTAITIPGTSALCQAGSGGAGAAGTSFAGGECTAIAGVWLSEQRPATPAAGVFNGSGGPQIWQPFFSFGGLGGSTAGRLSLGGHAGCGGYGAGGGGGGFGSTGGRGGDGGGGIIIVTSW